MAIEYQKLDPKEWAGFPIPFHYVSEYAYDYKLSHGGAGWEIGLVKLPYKTPYDRTFTDGLFPDYYEDCEAYGAFEGKKLAGVIETAKTGVDWKQRLWVTEISVFDGYKRCGIGKNLMNIAKTRALREGSRCIILETQSSNVNAIAFYLSEGFELNGFDRTRYHNDDVAKKEIYLEFVYFLK